MVNNEYTTIAVGQQFDLFKEKGFRLLNDGCYLEALESDDGFMMVLFLAGLKPDEKEILETEIMRTRIIQQGNKILFLIRFGESPMVFEASFDPTLYKDQRAMQIVFNNHMLTLVTVERFDNTIQTLRYTNFPMKLKQALITAWDSAYQEPNYSENYTEFLDGLYLRFSTLDLWEIATPTGFFGEGGLL